MLLIAEAMPRGGTLSVHLSAGDHAIRAAIAGEGRNAALNPRIASTVQGKVPPGELDSRVILAHLAHIQIRDAAATAEWSFGDNRGTCCGRRSMKRRRRDIRRRPPP